MFNEITKKIEWGTGTLILKTGKIAPQSDGAVMISMGDTVILCTVVSSKEPKPDVNFFPLTVHYREMFYAAGKIPGGYIKREGKASDNEVLIARLIDRPIRPLFSHTFFNETQIIATVLSYDPNHSPEILAMIGSSAALALTGTPYLDIVGAAKVGYINKGYVLNPTQQQLKDSYLELIIAGTASSVMMVEAEAKELSEEEMLGAIEFGHKQMQPVIALIQELANEAAKPKWLLPGFELETLENEMRLEIEQKVIEAYGIQEKQKRYYTLSHIKTLLAEKFLSQHSALKVDLAFEEVKAKVVRDNILNSNKRIDGRGPQDIRSIACETAILPKTHGSALFTRGETQVLAVTTLGTAQDEQLSENLQGECRDRFLLQYIFPPYSVGEATPFRAPGRREIGHGRLARKALNGVLPSKEEFPYTVRVVSETTACNGSSSMATVCGSSMSLMDAGVPLKNPVAGIAMGLIKERDNFIILSDILGDEDHLGDMDFKAAGSINGITALQMDIKVEGINYQIIQAALIQAKAGRMHILNKMAEEISQHRSELRSNAPQIKQIKIDKDKIRELIGPGGKVIREICELANAKIDISEDGIVQVAAIGDENMQLALNRIKSIVHEPEVGEVIEGTVVKILESGAFINIAGGKDGYLHISEISKERINNINDHLKVNQIVKVKINGFEKGKIKLSIKALNTEPDSIIQRASNGEEKKKETNRKNINLKGNTSNEQATTQPVIGERKYFT